MDTKGGPHTAQEDAPGKNTDSGESPVHPKDRADCSLQILKPKVTFTPTHEMGIKRTTRGEPCG